METLMGFLENSIKKRIDYLNETVDRSPEFVDMIIENEEKFQLLINVIPYEYREVLLGIYSNFCAQIADAEDVYYRKGFSDGMQLQQEINGLGGRK
ncbi:hypothetical protein [Paenibacillus qinlingensis]|uniref:Uncharacterized protein n=1 Tax=Paenibacillus qinlingensis TaxID=1837343 RepID=A0ABU1P7X6_9BACL|nr:hypothetical protein [Paenibacillus qinlingensis]MDR6555426.1 hypothetical protein [Paenibacillus qinlingensis]